MSSAIRLDAGRPQALPQPVLPATGSRSPHPSYSDGSEKHLELVAEPTYRRFVRDIERYDPCWKRHSIAPDGDPNVPALPDRSRASKASPHRFRAVGRANEADVRIAATRIPGSVEYRDIESARNRRFWFSPSLPQHVHDGGRGSYDHVGLSKRSRRPFHPDVIARHPELVVVGDLQDSSGWERIAGTSSAVCHAATMETSHSGADVPSVIEEERADRT